MSDQTQPPAIIDLQHERRTRQHELNEARLARVRSAFEKALPLSSSKPAKKHRSKKKKPKR
ncbi:hypothetical protein KEM63_11660 [Halopseudomonas nanhaiensis]|uniref:hypothetical protein n=1 Tax=Halopseudomonas nanhaiensis TaxID=2830842 RepID=UPI001CBAFC08|nr:hypothetical protein [Halopseudomonas nanhaiensis]UAW97464.1 hypothetical protein KEM63_11660 [Halopseudomonas nanhaiensis]